jgi:hypothetical protein
VPICSNNIIQEETAMSKKTLLQRALILDEARKRFKCRFQTFGASERDVGSIKKALAESAPERYKKAVFSYLMTMINGDPLIYENVRRICGEDLFKKLKKAGLRKVSF